MNPLYTKFIQVFFIIETLCFPRPPPPAPLQWALHPAASLASPTSSLIPRSKYLKLISIPMLFGGKAAKSNTTRCKSEVTCHPSWRSRDQSGSPTSQEQAYALARRTSWQFSSEISVRLHCTARTRADSNRNSPPCREPLNGAHDDGRRRCAREGEGQGQDCPGAPYARGRDGG